MTTLNTFIADLIARIAAALLKPLLEAAINPRLKPVLKEVFNDIDEKMTELPKDAGPVQVTNVFSSSIETIGQIAATAKDVNDVIRLYNPVIAAAKKLL